MKKLLAEWRKYTNEDKESIPAQKAALALEEIPEDPKALLMSVERVLRGVEGIEPFPGIAEAIGLDFKEGASPEEAKTIGENALRLLSDAIAKYSGLA
jgi:hypothetical protein